MMMELLTRSRFLMFRKKRSELDDELRFHLERSIAAKVGDGLPADEARRQALIEFGGVEAAHQVGRATAMGFWTSGPVVGSLIVAVVGTNTIPAIVNDPRFWTHEYRICGIAGLIVWVIALVGLRELSPALRDQLMVTMHDRVLIEARAKGLTEADIETALRRPFRQLLKPDIIVSAIAVSIMLLIYYTAVAFAVIYFVTVFGFSVKNADGLATGTGGSTSSR